MSWTLLENWCEPVIIADVEVERENHAEKQK